MLDAKDTFYIALRDRLAVVNPQRTMMVRGALRPGILVEDAEPVAAKMPRNVFVLRWTVLEKDPVLPQTMAILGCEIHYGTVGTEAALGLDRGRLLAIMDEELLQILRPLSAPVMNYSVVPATATGMTVLWTEPVFGATTMSRDSLERVVKVTVLARQAGGVQ
ncbi:MAG TPA: hypothetical protein VM554_10380 [Acidisarcina sp.]|nr:hypothetical protein [Acidisarcina sp.]